MWGKCTNTTYKMWGKGTNSTYKMWGKNTNNTYKVWGKGANSFSILFVNAAIIANGGELKWKNY